MDMWELYWLTRLDSFNNLTTNIIFMTITLILGLILWGIIYRENGNDDMVARGIKIHHKYIPRIIIVLFMIITLKIFIPTTKHVAIMLAGHWATNSEEMNKLPDNVVKTINTFLETYNKENNK